MRKLIIIFFAIGVLKLISFISLKNFDRHNAEYYEFIAQEFTIKKKEHYSDQYYLRHLTAYNNKIPPILRQKLEKYDIRNNEDSLLNRIWFQVYAQSLNLKDSAFVKHSYPALLQNTVTEEITKNRILRYYQDNNWTRLEPDLKQQVKGIINRILKTGDSLSVWISPFSYDGAAIYNNCQADSKSVPVHSNPFFYKGSLSHFSCEIRNQETDEIYRVEFR